MQVKQSTQAPRYLVKFVNTTWAIFDTIDYENIRVFSLLKEANEVQKIMNRKWNK